MRVSVPPGEQLRATKASASANLIRLGQGLRNSVPVLGQQIGMTLGDVALSLVGQLDLTLEVRAGKPGHRTSPFIAEPMVQRSP